MEVSIITSARNDDQARQLLQMLGMPFRKDG
jgi:ribosomal protein L5